MTVTAATLYRIRLIGPASLWPSLSETRVRAFNFCLFLQSRAQRGIHMTTMEATDHKEIGLIVWTSKSIPLGSIAQSKCHSERSEESAARLSRTDNCSGSRSLTHSLRFGVRDDTSLKSLRAQLFGCRFHSKPQGEVLKPCSINVSLGTNNP